jgi:soluble lytic murein transglycosylase-like protein
MVGGRLTALLAVALVAGAAAGTVGNAKAGEEPLFARLPALPQASGGPRCPIPKQFRKAFDAAARDTGLPLALLVAIGEIESNFRADAVSPAGARGLLQLMPTTAAELALDPDHPPSNVLAGARYLRLLLDRFQSTDLALAAYNAGPTAVDRAGGAPSMTTLTYVANVTTRWRALAGCR